MTTETAASVGSVWAGVDACRANASAMRCCACCGVKTRDALAAGGATAATLTGWQDTFVAAGEASLATRSTDGEALETSG